MFCIKYSVSGSKPAVWSDINIRGNRDPMLFHDKINANLECESLNLQYNHEGYSFSVEPYTSNLV